jgi:hypothetical protein
VVVHLLLPQIRRRALILPLGVPEILTLVRVNRAVLPRLPLAAAAGLAETCHR